MTLMDLLADERGLGLVNYGHLVQPHWAESPRRKSREISSVAQLKVGDLPDHILQAFDRPVAKLGFRGICRHFEGCDDEGKGFLHKLDFEQAIQDLDVRLAAADSKALLEAASGSSGMVKYGQFVEFLEASAAEAEDIMTILRSQLRERDVVEVLQRFDRTGSGEIDESEFVEGLEELLGDGKPPKRQQVSEMIARYPGRRKATVNYHQFAKAFRTTERGHQLEKAGARSGSDSDESYPVDRERQRRRR
ncbi:unnamed protein product [Chrysoparadoxa australica]